MSTVLEKIEKLQNAGFFGSLDVQMAGLVSRMHSDAKENLLIAVALASRAINKGHACVDLKNYAGKKWRDILEESLPGSKENEDTDEEDEALDNELDGILPDLEIWIKSLDSAIVGDGSETDKERKLFVRKDSRLYLRRYWDYERKVESKLQALNSDTGNKADDNTLSKYFEADDNKQKAASKKIIEKRLSLLSGGPGTGKTYTLVRAVMLLAEMKHMSGGTPDVKMVAPTGKAAVRMMESIKSAKVKLKVAEKDEDAFKTVPEDASTIHRLLGAMYHSPYFKHDSKNPLTADVVIVDEASMVDLPLMAKLLDALPNECSLVLVGDIDQLASVEPGRVYGDVCRAAEAGGPLDGCLTQLTKSRRFHETSIIGKVSRLVNNGKVEDAWNELKDPVDRKHIEVKDSTELIQENGSFKTLVEEKMSDFIKAKEPETVLAAADNFRILCALRNGPFGVKQMNCRVEKILSKMGLNPGGKFYDHQLIMVKVNTPDMNLYNGDVGVVLARDTDGKKELVAWFYDKDKSAKPIPVNLLPDHETAFAMTIHKSQGSEFPYVGLILPDDATSPVLTRELLYTGMTRVKIDENEKTGKLTMWCSESSFKKAVETKTERATGLFAPKQEDIK